MNKKLFLITLSSLFLSFVFSQNVPELLKGKWTSYSKDINFDGDSSQNFTVPEIILKPFYSLYEDKSFIPSSKKEQENLDVNDTVSHENNGDIRFEFETLVEGTNYGAWNIKILYPNEKQPRYAQVALFEDKLYMNFFIKKGKTYICQSNTDDIYVSVHETKREIICYYEDDDSFYGIRYWKTDIDVDGGVSYTENVSFSTADNTFEMPRFVKIGDQLYTCVTGRSTKIRNVTKSTDLPFSYKSNDDLIVIETPTFYKSLR